MLELKLLGAPQLRWNGDEQPLPAPKQLALLGYLALQSDPVTREELLELFWPGGKAANVRYALFKLRALPGADDWLELEDAFVAVRAASDARRAESAHLEGRHLDALAVWHESDEDDRLLLKGVKLRQGEPFNDWLERERSRFEQLYLDTVPRALLQLERSDDLERAEALAQRHLRRDPLSEAAHRVLMRCAWRRGDTAAALLQFESCRTLLRDELGVAPEEATLALLAEIERGDGDGGRSRRSVWLGSDPEGVPSRPERLIGRDDEVVRIEGALERSERVIAHGLGGAGKTALAAVLATRRLERGGGPLLWISAGQTGPAELFEGVAAACDAERELRLSDAPKELIARLLRERGVTLVVIDDVWNSYGLSELLDAVPAGTAVLVTSRQRHPRLERIAVGRMARAAALELLGLHAGRDLQGNPDADALCESLGDHAYALRLAGIALAIDDKEPAALLREVAAAPHTLTIDDVPSVGALLATSLAALDDAAYEAFMCYGPLATPSATPELVALCTRRELDESEEALFELQRRGLAERVGATGSDAVRYRIHDLAASMARAVSHLRATSVARACRDFLLRHHADVELIDAEIGNILAAVEQVRRGGEDALFVEMAWLLNAENAYYLARGHSAASFELLRLASEVAERIGDPSRAHHLYSRLGDAYRELYGRYGEALAAFETALQLARESGDREREVVMLTLIGTTLSQQPPEHERRGEADTFLQAAHRLAEEIGATLQLCQVLEHRGCLACLEGRLDDAEALFERDLALLGGLEGGAADSHDRDEIERLRYFADLNFGEVRRLQGRLGQALSLREAALATARSARNEIWQGYALQELGETHHQRGDRERAGVCYHEALALFRRNGARSSAASIERVLEQNGYPPLIDPPLPDDVPTTA